MAVGLPAKTTYANGDVFSASDINDTNGTINLIGQTQNFYAGKNAIINGDFSIWQRGSSFTGNGGITYTADRTAYYYDGNGAVTISRQSFTPGTAPVAGYEGQYFYRYAQTTAGTGQTYAAFYYQPVEDVRTFAGRTVTLSFWAKADAARTYTAYVNQYFGSGGSSEVTNSTTFTTTTGWVRYSYTVTLGSMAGKTIAATSWLSIRIEPNAKNTAQTLDIWGVQLETGSVATAFETATGTIQGELAACQRYYYRVVNPAQSGSNIAIGTYGSAATTGFVGVTIPNPVTMRTAPTSVDYSSSLVVSPDELNGSISVTGVALSGFSNSNNLSVLLTVSGATQYRPYRLYGSGATTYMGFSAEL
jgi:hypothetical protein